MNALTKPAVLTNEVNPLRIFDKAPTGRDRGVVVNEHNGLLLKAGEVAVYDGHMLYSGEGLVDGGLYAIEYQRPVAGMTWEMWWDKGEHRRSRIGIDRSVVILRRNSRLADCWNVCPLAMRDQGGAYLMSDTGIPEDYLYQQLLGRIIGIYNPAALPA